MRPVEIEFLVKDSTKGGIQRVSSSVNRETLKVLGQMDRIQAKIEKLRTTNADALDQDKNIAEIKKLEGQLDKLSAKMAKLSAQPIGPSATDIAATTRQYNGLNMSIQQIARELPSLAMGPQLFFMAISNNLPIFADHLAAARKEYAAMIAKGKEGIPVWKQITSSIVSWQTALAVGVMLLVTYGDEIAKWVSNLFKGKEALNSAAVAAEEYNNAMSKGRVDAAKDLSQAETLLKVATDQSRAMNLRREAVQQLQQLYPDYLGNMSQEAIMAGEASDAYARLKGQLIEVAQSRAAMDRITELAAAKLSPELEAIKKAEEAYEASKKKQVEYMQTMQAGGVTPLAALIGSKIYAGTGTAETALTESLTAFSEKYGIAGNNIIEINKAIEASEKKLIEAVTAFDIASTKATKKTPTADVKIDNNLLQARRDLEDEQNAIIEDSYAKRRAMAKTEFERQMHDIRVNREKLLAQDQAETGGTNYSAISTIFDARLLAVVEQYQQSLKQIRKEEQAAAVSSYDNLLEKYQKYLKDREALARQYDKDVAMLSTSTEDRLLAEEAKERALRDFDVAFASQFPVFEKWADAIVATSIDKLRELIALAEFELEQLDVAGADSEALAKAIAKLSSLQKVFDKATAPKDQKDGYDRWETLSEVLGRVNDDLQDLGDTIGGVFGEIIDVAGTVTTSTMSMVSGIVQLAKESTTAVSTTAESTSKAIASLEKASVILSIISAAVSIGQALFSLFENTESAQERTLRQAKEFNEELRVMNQRALIDQDDNSIFGDAVYRNFLGNIEAVRRALGDLEKDKKALLFRGMEEYQGTSLFLSSLVNPWTSVGSSIGNMRVETQHSTWFRSAKYASLKDLVPELFGDDGQINMDALAKFADESNEIFSKLSYENQQLIKSLVSDWETYEQALESVRDYLSSIFGDLGNTILDSMIAVADGTMSAADAMMMRLSSLADMVKEFAQNMIYAMTIGPLLEEAQKAIEDIYLGSGTEEEKNQAMLDVLGRLMTDVNDQQDNVTYLWQQVQELARERGIDLEKAGVSQSGKAGAMQTVSQERFTRAEGILTSIQAHIISGDLKMDNITAQMALQLDALNSIVSNTSPISQIYTLMSMIYREGLKVV